MKKKDKTMLSDAMTQWLQLKGLTTTQEEQMDALKELIVSIADRYPEEFVDGVLAVEGVGCLKQVANPMKVVFENGKPLNEIELVGLAKELGSMFQKTAINPTLVAAGIKRGDKDVLAAMKKHGVKVIQEKRIDVKKA